MTEGKMKKTMDFILEQQAQITATMGSLTETVKSLSLKVDRNAETAAALLAIAEIQAAEIRDLTESTRTLAERQRDADKRQREADERGRRTDERLDALINIVERHISEGHNGKA